MGMSHKTLLIFVGENLSSVNSGDPFSLFEIAFNNLSQIVQGLTCVAFGLMILKNEDYPKDSHIKLLCDDCYVKTLHLDKELLCPGKLGSR